MVSTINVYKHSPEVDLFFYMLPCNLDGTVSPSICFQNHDHQSMWSGRFKVATPQHGHAEEREREATIG